MPIKFPVFYGGGVFWVFLGGEVPIFFYGREDFSDKMRCCSTSLGICLSFLCVMMDSAKIPLA